MCPVEDHPVHWKVKHAGYKAGCFDRTGRNPPTYTTFTGEVITPRFESACRQIGVKVEGQWQPLLECIGCKANKDGEYILQARAAIDKEMARFIKADQRL